MDDTYRDAKDQSVSIGEAARLLGVSVGTLRNWNAAGKIDAYRTLGRQRRFFLSDIEAIKNRTAVPQERAS